MLRSALFKPILNYRRASSMSVSQNYSRRRQHKNLESFKWICLMRWFVAFAASRAIPKQSRIPNGQVSIVDADKHGTDVCAATRSLGRRTNGQIQSDTWSGSKYSIADRRLCAVRSKSEGNRHRCTTTGRNHIGQCDVEHRRCFVFADYWSVFG